MKKIENKSCNSIYLFKRNDKLQVYYKKRKGSGFMKVVNILKKYDIEKNKYVEIMSTLYNPETYSEFIKDLVDLALKYDYSYIITTATLVSPRKTIVHSTYKINV